MFKFIELQNLIIKPSGVSLGSRNLTGPSANILVNLILSRIYLWKQPYQINNNKN